MDVSIRVKHYTPTLSRNGLNKEHAYQVGILILIPELIL
jgi:hypothetical protein